MEFSTLTVNHGRWCLVWQRNVGGLGMCHDERGVSQIGRNASLAYAISVLTAGPPQLVVSSQLVYFRRSFTSYLQSLVSTRLSFPSALSLQQILFAALSYALYLSIPRGKNVFSWRFPRFHFVLGNGCLRRYHPYRSGSWTYL